MFRAIIVLLAAALLAGAVAAADEQLNGDDLYKQGRYEDAAAKYKIELSRDPSSALLHTNLGCALYHLGRHDEAIVELRSALQLKTEPAQAARIHYNIGNCYFSTNRIDEAIKSYKEALRLNPNDRLAKYNLEIALKRNNEPPKRSGNPQSQPDQSSGEGDSEQPQNDEQNPNSSGEGSQKPQSQMTRDEAERILEALRQSEKGPTYRGNNQRSYFNTTVKRDW
jgi:Ca-activated chloride channel homolog